MAFKGIYQRAPLNLGVNTNFFLASGLINVEPKH